MEQARALPALNRLCRAEQYGQSGAGVFVRLF